MRRAAVVTLAVVFDRQLPVAVFNDVRFVGDFRASQIERCEAWCHGLVERRNVRGRFVVQAHKDQPAYYAYLDRHQAAAGRIKILPHVRGVFETAVETVRPLMVGADEHSHGTLALLAQAGAAMTAHVSIRSNDVVVVANDDDRGAADIDRRDIAGLAYVGGDTRHDPVLVEEDIDVVVKDVLPAEQGAGHAVTGSPTAKQCAVRSAIDARHPLVPIRFSTLPGATSVAE